MSTFLSFQSWVASRFLAWGFALMHRVVSKIGLDHERKHIEVSWSMFSAHHALDTCPLGYEEVEDVSEDFDPEEHVFIPESSLEMAAPGCTCLYCKRAVAESGDTCSLCGSDMCVRTFFHGNLCADVSEVVQA